MAKFLREKSHPACIWNGEKNKPIRFIDDICETSNEYEIGVLTKAGYKQIDKVVEKIEEVVGKPKKKVLKKIVKPLKKEK